MKLLLHWVRKDAEVMRPFWLGWTGLVAAQVGMEAKLVGVTLGGPGGLALAGICILVLSALVAARRYGRRGHGMPGLLCLQAFGVFGLGGLLANAITPVALDPAQFQTVAIYFHVVGVLWVIFGYILAAAIVMQDTPVGTSMFWATRPISGGSLLLAKLLGVTGACVLTPAIIWLPWRIYCGYGFSDLWHASLSTMVLAAFAAFAGLLMAAISGSGPRFVLYNVVGVGLAITGSLLTVAGNGTYRGHEHRVDLAATRILLGFGVAVAASGWAVAAQYRGRRHAWSLTVLMSGLVVAVLLGNFFPFSLPPGTERRPERADFSDAARIDEFSLRVGGRQPGLGPWPCFLSFTLKGIPVGVCTGTGSGSVQFTWPGGQSRFELPRIYSDQEVSAAIGASLGFDGPTAEPFISYHVDDVLIDQATLERIRKGVATAQLRLDLPFKRPRVVRELAVESGNAAAAEGTFVHLMAVNVLNEVPNSTYVQRHSLFSSSSGRLTMDGAQSMGKTDRMRRPTLSVWAGVDHAEHVQYSLCFIYRGKRSYVVNGGPEDGTLQYFDATSVFETSDRLLLALPSPLVLNADGWAPPAGWTAATSLGIVRYYPLGTLQRALVAPAIRLY